MLAGTDYLSLNTPEYTVQSLKGWGIRSGNKVGEAQDLWGTAEDGHLMKGTGYYMNTGVARLDLSKQGLKVDFNPSTLLHPFELITDRTTLSKAVDLVRVELDRLGVCLDLDRSAVSRIDLTKQAPLKGGPAAYSDVWGGLQGKRMQRNRKQFPDGFEMGNSQRKAVFYHKEKQLTEAKRLTVSTPKDLTRAEVRWIKPRAAGNTKTGPGIGRLIHLLEAEPEQLTEAYNRFLLKDVFRTPDGWQTVLELDWNTEVDYLKQLREKHPRGAFDHYLKMEGAEAVLHRFGSVDLLRSALAEAGYSRRTVYRKLDALNKSITQKGFLDARRGDATTAQKIDKLRRLFCS